MSDERIRGKDPLNTNSTIDDRERRRLLLCDRCRPHRGENASHSNSRRGAQKRRYKNKRRLP